MRVKNLSLALVIGFTLVGCIPHGNTRKSTHVPKTGNDVGGVKEDTIPTVQVSAPEVKDEARVATAVADALVNGFYKVADANVNTANVVLDAGKRFVADKMAEAQELRLIAKQKAQISEKILREMDKEQAKMDVEEARLAEEAARMIVETRLVEESRLAEEFRVRAIAKCEKVLDRLYTDYQNVRNNPEEAESLDRLGRETLQIYVNLTEADPSKRAEVLKYRLKIHEQAIASIKNQRGYFTNIRVNVRYE